MKDCKKIHPLLSFYIEEQLPPSERKQVEKHLDACEEARLELGHLKNLIAGLRKMPEPAVPSDLHARIMNRLGGNGQLIRPHRGFWGPTTWALSAAAVFVLIFLNQYPNWRDTTQVQPHPGPQEDFAPQLNSSPANAPAATSNNHLSSLDRTPAKSASGYAKKESFNLGIQKNKDFAAGATADKFAEEKPVPSLKKEESFSVKTSAAPRMARAAKSSKMKPAEAPEAQAALPPQPAPAAAERMDQSLQSLTYSQEREVRSWNGNNGPATLEQQELVTDPDTFQKYWRVSHPAEAPPAADFTKEAVVVLMAGEKPTAGYSISVTRLEEKADQLAIHYRVLSPKPDAVTAQIITRPWAMQIIPKPSKPVIFLKDP